MADERLAALREKLGELRGLSQVKLEDTQGPNRAGGRPLEQPDAQRERYRHLLEGKQAELAPRSAAGYGKPEQHSPEKAEDRVTRDDPRASKEVSESGERLKQAGMSQVKEAKESPSPRATTSQQQRRSGHER